MRIRNHLPSLKIKSKLVFPKRILNQSYIGDFFHWLLSCLSLFSAIHQNHGLEAEETKTAIYKSRKRALGESLIQLMPVVITSVVLSANFQTVYWEDVGIKGQNSRLSAFQFAAKVHEVLIMTSLSATVLHRVQYDLARGRGVPLGSLFAGFQISQVNSLWDPGLWATALSPGFDFHRASFLLLVVISVVLCAAVGPASAIAILPTLDWWIRPTSNDLFGPRLSNASNSRLYLSATKSQLWPRNLTSPNSPASSDASFEFCPPNSTSKILSWSEQQSGPILSWNMTMAIDCSFQFERFLVGGLINNSNGNSVAFTESTKVIDDRTLLILSDSVLEGLEYPSTSMRTKLSLANGEPTLVPRCFATCLPALPSQAGVLRFPQLYDKSGTGSWYFDASTLLNSRNVSKATDIIWVDPPDQANETSSLGAILVINDNWGDLGDLSNQAQNITTDDTIFITCSVVVGWRPLEVWIEMNAGNYIHTTGSEGVLDNNMLSLLLQPDFQSLRLGSGWVDTFDPQLLGRADEVLFAMRRNGTTLSVSFQSTLSILLTEALAKYTAGSRPTIVSERKGNSSLFYQKHDGEQWSMPLPIVKSDLQNFTEIKVAIYRYGYSWRIEGVTIQIATAILLIHIFIALIHTGIVVCGGWSCPSWKSILEITVLAINSTPTKKLDNTCAGVARLDTYKHIVKIREVSQARLELVLDEDGKFELGKPTEGKKYGGRQTPF